MHLMVTLRQELDRLANEAFSLATWKLVAIAAFVVAGLGWGGTKPSPQSGLLLLCSTGFLCAYTDCLFYRRGTATHIIASFLRRCPETERQTPFIRAYERFTEDCRRKGRFFQSNHVLQFVTSGVFSLGPPIMGYFAYKADWSWYFAFIPATAFGLNLIMFMLYCRKRSRIQALKGPIRTDFPGS
jgi:hypothetical protein